jgi:hypothetical protein
MHSALMEDAGDRLKRARIAAGHETAREAADALRVPYPTYAAHENNSRGFTREAQRYARFFGCDLVWLLTGTGSPAGNPFQKVAEQLPQEDQKLGLDYLEFLKSRKAK